MRKIAFPIVLILSLSGLIGCNQHKVAASSDSSPDKVLYYVDPMHPAYRSDKPGIAPDCGMQLVPVYAYQTNKISEKAASPAAITLTAQQRQIAGVRVSAAEKKSGTNKLRLFGRVAVDESRLFRVNAGIEGYIQSVAEVTTGSFVKKDQLLATFSAPSATMTLQTYLLNLGAEDRYTAAAAASSPEAQSLGSTNANIQQRSQQLHNLGMSSIQMQEIRKTRQVPEFINILAPGSGIVVARNVSPGLKFDRGAEWFRIADLSRVWIIANVTGTDVGYVHPGVRAQVSVPNQNKSFPAIISDVLPQVDPTTGVMKVRLEADNPGFVLRPDMFVDVVVSVVLPSRIMVAHDAVFDTGLKKTVFVERSEGMFEPREVETGARFEDSVEIVKGLQPGERIVVSGNFLLDSESRLRNPEASGTALLAGSQDKTGTAAEFAKTELATKSSSTKAQHAKDPKCGMELDPAKALSAGLTANHNGTTYYFCSKGCKEEFLANPEKFLAAGHAGVVRD